MVKRMKKLFAILLCAVLLCSNQSLLIIAESTVSPNSQETTKDNSTKEGAKESKSAQEPAQNADLNIESASAVLIEGSTGSILFEKNKDEQRFPASITKIMTLILIFEALDSGKIKLEDKVTVSEHAASMGGSQVYLEPNETQTVNDMIKCISIASANDACVAMAELIAGSETEFAAMMNQKAQDLGMKNTKFMNCCGLDDDIAEGSHYTSAYDIALMSRELIMRHPEVSKYSTTWMDSIIHTTKKGESEFGLTNTNKLVRTYNGITGLKTGSTSKAKYCLSATAKRNGMDLIAVVMAAPEPKQRFAEAASMLDYGFANCSMFEDDNKDVKLKPLKIKGGRQETVQPKVTSSYKYLLLKGKTPDKITKEVRLSTGIKAPVNQGDQVGELVYSYDGKEIGKVSIVSEDSVEKANYLNYLEMTVKKFFICAE